MGQTFGAWLRRQLTRREMSQSDLSRRSGIATGRISEWANDVRLPSPESCEKIADALGLDPDDVLTHAGHRHEPVDDPERAALIAMLRRVDLKIYDGQNARLLRGMMEDMLNHRALPAEKRR